MYCFGSLAVSLKPRDDQKGSEVKKTASFGNGMQKDDFLKYENTLFFCLIYEVGLIARINGENFGDSKVRDLSCKF